MIVVTAHGTVPQDHEHGIDDVALLVARGQTLLRSTSFGVSLANVCEMAITWFFANFRLATTPGSAAFALPACRRLELGPIDFDQNVALAHVLP